MDGLYEGQNDQGGTEGGETVTETTETVEETQTVEAPEPTPTDTVHDPGPAEAPVEPSVPDVSGQDVSSPAAETEVDSEE